MAHVLVEVLLDAALLEEDPTRLDRYFGALGRLDPAEVERLAGRLTPAPPIGLGDLFAGFVRARFVADYLTDAGVAKRLDQTFARTRQAAIGPVLTPLLPALREVVRGRAADLVASARPGR